MNDTALKPWYGHRTTPGFREFIADRDVYLLSRKEHTGSAAHIQRRDTRAYAEKIVGEVETLWPSSLWFAPEAHGADAGAGDSWHWDELHEPYENGPGSVWLDSHVPVPNDFKFLEAIYYQGEDLTHQLAQHGGQGWQWPIMVVFEQQPNDQQLKPLKTFGVPYLVLERDVEPPSEPPDEPVRDIASELAPIVESAETLSRSMKRGKDRRFFRRNILKPLRAVLMK
jgi:hypothetical protein